MIARKKSHPYIGTYSCLYKEVSMKKFFKTVAKVIGTILVFGAEVTTCFGIGTVAGMVIDRIWRKEDREPIIKG